MRPIIKTTICALAAATLAAPAVAAADMFLHLDDVKGGSAAKAGGGTQLEILSWSWGATESGRVNLNSSKSNVEEADSRANVTSPRDTGSGIPTEKRQHGWVTLSQPLDRGSVRVKVRFPWIRCAVGAAFPDAVLQNDAGRYELENVLISGCAPDSVSLDYAKVKATTAPDKLQWDIGKNKKL